MSETVATVLGIIAVLGIVWIFILGFTLLDVTEAWLKSLERKFNGKHCSSRCFADRDFADRDFEDRAEEDEELEDEERGVRGRDMFRKG